MRTILQGAALFVMVVAVRQRPCRRKARRFSRRSSITSWCVQR